MGSPPLARGVLEQAVIVWEPTKDHPRLRGEYWLITLIAAFVKGSPPLARGVRYFCYSKCRFNRITPACAGSTFHHTILHADIKDHPRLRGEYLWFNNVADERLGSPPLARGVLKSIVSLIPELRITPACAGSTTAKAIQINTC